MFTLPFLGICFLSNVKITFLWVYLGLSLNVYLYSIAGEVCFFGMVLAIMHLRRQL